MTRRPLPRAVLAGTLVLALAPALACQGELRVESPGERRAARLDTAPSPIPRDTLYRPAPIDSAPASFAWVTDRPSPHVPSERAFPESAEDAVRQFLRVLAQTGAGSAGTVGTGELGYERAFTYVHPSVRRGRTADEWSAELAGILRPAIVRLAPVPDDSTRVFAELLVLREVDGHSLLGFYWGHLAAERGDNGWQLTGARLASEDWAAPLGGAGAWRTDRARAAQVYAAENPDYAVDLVRLASGAWVPLARPAPASHLALGLPTLP